MVIYADILLVLNWWIDYLLLLGVSRAMGEGRRLWRVALGALVGAVCSFVLFLPPLPVWLSLLIKLVAAAGMVLVAFRWKDGRTFFRRMLLLFGLSAGLAGLCGALYFFAAPAGFCVINGVVYYSVPPLLLVGLTVLCYGVLWAAETLLRRRAPAGMTYRLRVQHHGRQSEFLCLYDSGNHLTEPFSGIPVLVVERAVVDMLVEVPSSVEVIPACSEVGWRLVPYDTLGGSGLLPAFIPQRVTVRSRGREQALPDCYIAVCERLGRGEYQGLMGSALGEELRGKVAEK